MAASQWQGQDSRRGPRRQRKQGAGAKLAVEGKHRASGSDAAHGRLSQEEGAAQGKQREGQRREKKR